MTTPINTCQDLLPSSSILMGIDIHTAIKQGNLEVIRNILSHERVQINFFNEEGYTPLLAALKAKKSDVVLLLIELGADVVLPSKKGSPPLMFAILSSDLGAAQAILEKCPQEARFVRSDGATPLHIAAQQGNVEMIELLYTYGADMHACTNSGATPWNLLLQKGLDNPFNIPSKLLNVLFRGGAFSLEDRPLMALIQSSSPLMADLNALVNRIDLQEKDPKGSSWMEILLQNCDPTHPESLVLLRLLLEKGAKPPSFLQAKWENVFSDLIHSRQKTLCAILELINVDDENCILNSHFLLPFAEDLTEEALFNMLVSDKIKDYLQLTEFSDVVFKKITALILKKKYSDLLRIGTGVLTHASITFQEKLIRTLLKQGMEPFSLFSTKDSRCLLRIYVDFNREEPFNYFSNHYISFLSRFITFPAETIKKEFDGMRLLEYRWHHCRSASQEMLFKFALQSIGLPSGSFLANIEDPLSCISTANGGSDCYSYPYTALYAEAFLENMSDTCLSDCDKKEVLKAFLASLDSEYGSERTDLHQKEVFALIPTGHKEHSFPVLFFTSAYGAMRAVANRGAGGFAKSSLLIHAINQENLSQSILQATRESATLAKKESREYLYRASLQKLDANGCLPITKLVSKVFGKKAQRHQNCIVVAAKTSFELLMAAKVLQNRLDNIEKHLIDVNTQYKWFTLFTAIHAMNDLYVGSEITSQFFDLTAERDLRKKVKEKYERTAKRFGTPPLFIQNQYDLFLNRSEQFKETIPVSFRQNFQIKTKNEEAIIRGEVQWIEQCLHDPSAFNEKNCYGNTALQTAILHNQIEVAELLCQQPGIDFTSQNYDNESALMMAIRLNRPTLIEKILKVCPQSVHISKNGFFPLDFAFARGDKVLVEMLIEYGANPNRIFYTLGWRFFRKHRELFEFILDKCSENERVANFKELENKIFDGILDDLDVQEYRDLNYVNLEKTEKMYIDDLKFLYEQGMRWEISLEKKAIAAFGFPADSQSELLAYIRENKK